MEELHGRLSVAILYQVHEIFTLLILDPSEDGAIPFNSIQLMEP